MQLHIIMKLLHVLYAIAYKNIRILIDPPITERFCRDARNSFSGRLKYPRALNSPYGQYPFRR